MAEIPLSNGGVALVDGVDAHLSIGHTWSKNVYGYATTMWRHPSGKWRPESLHRIVMGCEEGDGLIVDHVNMNILDCRRSNLRIATKQQNQVHQRKRRCSTSSKYKGVSWQKDIGRWRARHARQSIGCYGTEEEAARAYDERVLAIHGEFAVTNLGRGG